MDSHVPYAFLVLVFIAACFGVEGVFRWWNDTRGPDAKRLAQRINRLSGLQEGVKDETSLFKERVYSDSPSLHRLLKRAPGIPSIDGLIVQSGLPLTVARLIAYTIATFLATLFLLTVVSVPTGAAVFVSLVLAAFPTEYVVWKRHKRLRRIEELLPDALDMIGRAMRAGFSFPNALKMAGEELPEPMGREFRMVFDEIAFGVDTHDALLHLVQRVPNLDLRFFVIAVITQRETGGNLTEILANISRVVRERLKLMGQIRTISADGRMSAWVLCLLPFITVLLIGAINPDYMSSLWTTPRGVTLIYTGLGLMTIGVLWVRKIIRLRV